MKKLLLFTLISTAHYTFSQNLSIGDSYQGGIVSYLDPSGEFGFIAAPSDQSSGTAWGCYGSNIAGTNGTAIGDGDNNTAILAANCVDAGIAAKLCDNLSLGGYSDWFLPSKDELYLLYQNKTAIGGFVNNWYWSSSQDINSSTTAAWGLDFFDGTWGNWNKTSNMNVRAIREFVPPPSASGLLTFCDGQSVTLTAPSGISFLWNNGETSQSINVATSGSFYVTVTTGAGSFTTSESVVTILNSPSIQTEPTDQFVEETQTANFFMYSLDNPITYQWQTDLGVGFQDLSEVSQYSGTTTNSLSVSNCTLSNNNQPFRCIIDNGQCQDTTDIAFLNVSGLGIQENTVVETYIYPNPASNKMMISVDSEDTECTIQFIGIDGKGSLAINSDIKNGAIQISNIDFLEDGIYFVIIAVNDVRLSFEKVMIKK